MTGRIETESEEDYEIKPLNFCFAIIEHKLIWVNYEQKKIWELDTL